MAGRMIALVLASSVAFASPPALAQTADTATDVAPLTVTAARRPPTEMLPDFDTCLQPRPILSPPR